jgi:hypothetical protein
VLTRGEYDASNGHLVDGPLPQADRDKVQYRDAARRQLLSFKSVTAFKNIKDGTSKTLLAGEVSLALAESGHAFNGDHLPGYPIGELRPFCNECTVPETLNGDHGFGGPHPGVAIFGMCDGSVSPLARTIDLAVLDNMATRAGNEVYDIDGRGHSCHNTP